MKREFIRIDGLTNVLSPSEMKKVTGGERIYPYCLSTKYDS